MKYHKAKFRDLSETAGQVTQQHKGPLCLRTCLKEIPRVSSLQLDCCYCRLDFVTKAKPLLATPLSNQSDNWAGDGRRGEPLPICLAHKNLIEVKDCFSSVPNHKTIDRRFRDPFLSYFYYPVPPAVLNTWKVGPEFSSTAPAFLTCINS